MQMPNPELGTLNANPFQLILIGIYPYTALVHHLRNVVESLLSQGKSDDAWL